ncbi:MAG: Sua5/YciO/YrdC/YwlC family protein [Bacteroidota bacterium]
MLFDDKLSDIIRTLENDGVLLHPTDTDWGLAGSVFSKKAIDKIYHLKKRDRSHPLLLLVDSLDMLKKFVPHIHPRIETLLHFHLKPLTVIYPNVVSIPKYARAKDNSVAIRIIRDQYCNEIIKLLGNPIVSSSANLHGQPHPKTFADINQSIVSNADFVSLYRRKENVSAQPSVMINYDEEGEINFLRL